MEKGKAKAEPKTKRMKLHKWKDIKDEHLTPRQQLAARSWAERETLKMNLRALRELAGKTQAEVAPLLAISQAELSRAERREDHLLSTLRKYVEALGGQLEVVAVFGNKQVRLSGV